MSYTLPEFLAHAVALEQEAADRYLELADMMEAHRNDEVSKVFRDMVRYSEMHRDEIKARVGERIGHHEQLALADGVAAEEIRIRHLACVEPVSGLEEQAIGVYKADQGNRRLADARCKVGEIVEARLVPGVEHAIAAQRRQARALLFIGR